MLFSVFILQMTTEPDISTPVVAIQKTDTDTDTDHINSTSALHLIICDVDTKSELLEHVCDDVQVVTLQEYRDTYNKENGYASIAIMRHGDRQLVSDLSDPAKKPYIDDLMDKIRTNTDQLCIYNCNFGRKQEVVDWSLSTNIRLNFPKGMYLTTDVTGHRCGGTKRNWALDIHIVGDQVEYLNVEDPVVLNHIDVYFKDVRNVTIVLVSKFGMVMTDFTSTWNNTIASIVQDTTNTQLSINIKNAAGRFATPHAKMMAEVGVKHTGSQNVGTQNPVCVWRLMEKYPFITTALMVNRLSRKPDLTAKQIGAQAIDMKNRMAGSGSTAKVPADQINALYTLDRNKDYVLTRLNKMYDAADEISKSKLSIQTSIHANNRAWTNPVSTRGFDGMPDYYHYISYLMIHHVNSNLMATDATKKKQLVTAKLKDLDLSQIRLIHAGSDMMVDNFSPTGTSAQPYNSDVSTDMFFKEATKIEKTVEIFGESRPGTEDIEPVNGAHKLTFSFNYKNTYIFGKTDHYFDLGFTTEHPAVDYAEMCNYISFKNRFSVPGGTTLAGDQAELREICKYRQDIRIMNQLKQPHIDMIAEIDRFVSSYEPDIDGHFPDGNFVLDTDEVNFVKFMVKFNSYISTSNTEMFFEMGVSDLARTWIEKNFSTANKFLGKLRQNEESWWGWDRISYTVSDNEWSVSRQKLPIESPSLEKLFVDLDVTTLRELSGVYSAPLNVRLNLNQFMLIRKAITQMAVHIDEKIAEKYEQVNVQRGRIKVNPGNSLPKVSFDNYMRGAYSSLAHRTALNMDVYRNTTVDNGSFIVHTKTVNQGKDGVLIDTTTTSCVYKIHLTANGTDAVIEQLADLHTDNFSTDQSGRTSVTIDEVSYSYFTYHLATNESISDNTMTSFINNVDAAATHPAEPDELDVLKILIQNTIDGKADGALSYLFKEFLDVVESDKLSTEVVVKSSIWPAVKQTLYASYLNILTNIRTDDDDADEISNKKTAYLKFITDEFWADMTTRYHHIHHFTKPTIIMYESVPQIHLTPPYLEYDVVPPYDPTSYSGFAAFSKSGGVGGDGNFFEQTYASFMTPLNGGGGNALSNAAEGNFQQLFSYGMGAALGFETGRAFYRSDVPKTAWATTKVSSKAAAISIKNGLICIGDCLSRMGRATLNVGAGVLNVLKAIAIMILRKLTNFKNVAVILARAGNGLVSVAARTAWQSADAALDIMISKVSLIAGDFATGTTTALNGIANLANEAVTQISTIVAQGVVVPVRYVDNVGNIFIEMRPLNAVSELTDKAGVLYSALDGDVTDIDTAKAAKAAKMQKRINVAMDTLASNINKNQVTAGNVIKRFRSDILSFKASSTTASEAVKAAGGDVKSAIYAISTNPKLTGLNGSCSTGLGGTSTAQDLSLNVDSVRNTLADVTDEIATAIGPENKTFIDQADVYKKAAGADELLAGAIPPSSGEDLITSMTSKIQNPFAGKMTTENLFTKRRDTLVSSSKTAKAVFVFEIAAMCYDWYAVIKAHENDNRGTIQENSSRFLEKWKVAAATSAHMRLNFSSNPVNSDFPNYNIVESTTYDRLITEGAKVDFEAGVDGVQYLTRNIYPVYKTIQGALLDTIDAEGDWILTLWAVAIVSTLGVILSFFTFGTSLAVTSIIVGVLLGVGVGMAGINLTIQPKILARIGDNVKTSTNDLRTNLYKHASVLQSFNTSELYDMFLGYHISDVLAPGICKISHINTKPGNDNDRLNQLTKFLDDHSHFNIEGLITPAICEILSKSDTAANAIPSGQIIPVNFLITYIINCFESRFKLDELGVCFVASPPALRDVLVRCIRSSTGDITNPPIVHNTAGTIYYVDTDDDGNVSYYTSGGDKVTDSVVIPMLTTQLNRKLVKTFRCPFDGSLLMIHDDIYDRLGFEWWTSGSGWDDIKNIQITHIPDIGILLSIPSGDSTYKCSPVPNSYTEQLAVIENIKSRILLLTAEVTEYMTTTSYNDLVIANRVTYLSVALWGSDASTFSRPYLAWDYIYENGNIAADLRAVKPFNELLAYFDTRDDIMFRGEVFVGNSPNGVPLGISEYVVTLLNNNPALDIPGSEPVAGADIHIIKNLMDRYLRAWLAAHSSSIASPIHDVFDAAAQGNTSIVNSDYIKSLFLCAKIYHEFRVFNESRLTGTSGINNSIDLTPGNDIYSSIEYYSVPSSTDPFLATQRHDIDGLLTTYNDENRMGTKEFSFFAELDSDVLDQLCSLYCPDYNLAGGYDYDVNTKGCPTLIANNIRFNNCPYINVADSDYWSNFVMSYTPSSLGVNSEFIQFLILCERFYANHLLTKESGSSYSTGEKTEYRQMYEQTLDFWPNLDGVRDETSFNTYVDGLFEKIAEIYEIAESDTVDSLLTTYNDENRMGTMEFSFFAELDSDVLDQLCSLYCTDYKLTGGYDYDVNTKGCPNNIANNTRFKKCPYINVAAIGVYSTDGDYWTTVDTSYKPSSLGVNYKFIQFLILCERFYANHLLTKDDDDDDTEYSTIEKTEYLQMYCRGTLDFWPNLDVRGGVRKVTSFNTYVDGLFKKIAAINLTAASYNPPPPTQTADPEPCDSCAVM
jgi:hypothetical protein